MVLGILMFLGVPQYIKVSENGKASQSVTLLNMIASANRMYAVDHRGTHAAGQLTDTCNSGACTNDGDPCNLTRCGYLTIQSWDNLPYAFYTLDPGAAPGSCNLSGFAGNSFVACAARKVCGGSVTKNCVGGTSPYAGWGYVVDPSTVFQAVPTSNGPPPASF
jgi:competence protein ComGC